MHIHPKLGVKRGQVGSDMGNNVEKKYFDYMYVSNNLIWSDMSSKTVSRTLNVV